MANGFLPTAGTRFQSPQRPGTGIDPRILITTGLYNPQPGDPRFKAHQERIRQHSQASRPAGRPIRPIRFPQFLSPTRQRARGARAGTLGPRQGPIFKGKPAFSPFARAALKPGQSTASQIRQLVGGFGQRPPRGGPLSFGLLGQGPASGGRFGTFGRAFGRLGQRGRRGR